MISCPFLVPSGVNTWKTIVYRDIKCESVFVANLGTRVDHSNLKIKLGDFGLSAVYDGKNNVMPSYWGTKVCWPPEQTITRMATPASDVWATGCVIHELAHGFSPIVSPSTTAAEYRRLHTGLPYPAQFSKRQIADYWAMKTPPKPIPINRSSYEHDER